VGLERLRRWARAIKRDVLALWIAGRDPRTPVSAKLLAALVAGYALSPIDLIPDFIPVLGYLDDLVLLPLGIALVVRLIPAPLMSEFRDSAASMDHRPVARVAALGIVAAWIAAAGWGLAWLLAR
jgi:uncharacterized membrane protein YkvA (DUF1232 family)